MSGLDLVSLQIRIAAGATFENLGITQESISLRGNAIQCRITTEGNFEEMNSDLGDPIDPGNGFAPDTGKIEVYRSAGGNGIRLDGGAGYAGASITPHYDSLLVKVTCHGQTYEEARRKVLRALAEFRIRGSESVVVFLLTIHQA